MREKRRENERENERERKGGHAANRAEFAWGVAGSGPICMQREVYGRECKCECECGYGC